jgi:DNA-binding transcriptional LysR family regulator
MDLRRLRYFIAVLEAGSLTRAASTLYVAQPALTAQIKKLEEELEAQLFERSYAGVTPTLAGLRLYEDAQRLLSDVDTMSDRIRRLPKGPEGSVTLALPFLLASLLSGPVLARLRRSHPRIRVFVRDDLSLLVRQAMLEQRADVGVLVETPAFDGLHCQSLAREAIFFCGRDSDGRVASLLRPKNTRGAARSRWPDIAFKDAAALPLVMQSRRFAIRRQVEETATQCGLALNIEHEHDSTRVIRSLYLSGAGFTFTPACTLPDASQRRSGWIVARVVRPQLARTYTVATVTGKPLGTAAEVVRQALAQEARALIETGRWQATWQGARLLKTTATSD